MPSQFMSLISYAGFAIPYLLAPVSQLVSFSSGLPNMGFYALAAKNRPIGMVVEHGASHRIPNTTMES